VDQKVEGGSLAVTKSMLGKSILGSVVETGSFRGSVFSKGGPTPTSLDNGNNKGGSRLLEDSDDENGN